VVLINEQRSSEKQMQQRLTKLILTLSLLLILTNGLYASSKEIQNQVIKTLKVYGDAKAYGFEEKIALKHDIVGVYDFIYKSQQTKLVIASTNIIKGNNKCRACGPKLSLFIIKDTQVLLSQVNAFTYGLWGDGPSKDTIKIIKLGLNDDGFMLPQYGMMGGWEEEGENFLLPVNGKFEFVLTLSTSSNNAGSYDESDKDWKSTSWDSNISYYQGESEFYDIVLFSSGIDYGNKFNKISLYRFDGKKYQKLKSVRPKIKLVTLEEYAYKMMTGKEIKEPNILVKTNSKKINIYCLSDMSICKTKTEVEAYIKNQ